MATELKLRFSGGMELLFDGQKALDVSLPLAPGSQMREVLPWIRDNLIKERPELFMDGESIRPGVLVLINEADWELEGELDYGIKDGDEIVFISTLHGG